MVAFSRPANTHEREYPVQINAGNVNMRGDLTVPEKPAGIVLFSHGSGSSRLSPRNRYVAQVLRNAGMATLLFDLLSEEEEIVEREDAHLRFDISLLNRRLVIATEWMIRRPEASNLPMGYFGASTGAAAALQAAAEKADVIKAVVSRGGRPDLADASLPLVRAPTLLIVGGRDVEVLELNRRALAKLRVEKKLVVLPGATHLFEEPGALQEVGRVAAEWFKIYLKQEFVGS